MRGLPLPSPIFLVSIVTSYHILHAPYTKVEESFTLHATHDVLAYGLHPRHLSEWDHISFPGAVPRSFLPSILLGCLTWPLAVVGASSGLMKDKMTIQFLIRFVLAALYTLALGHLSSTLAIRFSPKVSTAFVLLSLTQFHGMYYAGRTLPNFMAMPGVVLGTSLVLRYTSKVHTPEARRRGLRKAVVLLTAVATNIRLELALLLLPLVGTLVLRGDMTAIQAVKYGAMGGFGSLLLSVPVDFTLWRPALSHPDFPFSSPIQVLWPELSSLIYNVVEGESASWGVSPWYYYLINALPKLCLASLPLAAGGLVWAVSRVRDDAKGTKGALRGVMRVCGPGVIALLGGMSCVGHKEWRFVVYLLPIINTIAALSTAALWDIKHCLRPIARLIILGLLGSNTLYTGFSAYLSMHNYPGGQVWRILEPLALPENSTIHFSSYPLQTGASLFTFLHGGAKSFAFPEPRQPRWVYDKSEDSGISDVIGAVEKGVDCLVTDDWEGYVELTEEGYWEVVQVVQGLGGVSRGGKYGLWVEWSPKIGVLRRKAGAGR